MIFLTIIFYLVLSVLGLILFYKVWKMTDDIKKITNIIELYAKKLADEEQRIPVQAPSTPPTTESVPPVIRPTPAASPVPPVVPETAKPSSPRLKKEETTPPSLPEVPVPATPMVSQVPPVPAIPPVPSVVSPAPSVADSDNFRVGDIVADVETKEQMRIKSIFNGRHACYTLNGKSYKGSFTVTEIRKV